MGQGLPKLGEGVVFEMGGGGGGGGVLTLLRCLVHLNLKEVSYLP